MALPTLRSILSNADAVESALEHSTPDERQIFLESLPQALASTYNVMLPDSNSLLQYLQDLWRRNLDFTASDGNDPRLYFWLHFVDSPNKLSSKITEKFQQRLTDCFGHQTQLLGEQYWVEDEPSTESKSESGVVFLLNIVNEHTSLHDSCRNRDVPLVGWTIYNVCLASSLRGRRLAKPFMQEVLNEFQRKHSNVNEIYLTVYSDNEPAVRLYKSVGFERIDTVCQPRQLDIMKLRFMPS